MRDRYLSAPLAPLHLSQTPLFLISTAGVPSEIMRKWCEELDRVMLLGPRFLGTFKGRHDFEVRIPGVFERIEAKAKLDLDLEMLKPTPECRRRVLGEFIDYPTPPAKDYRDG